MILDCDDIIGKSVNCNSINSLLEYSFENGIEYIRVWRTKNREHKKYKTDYDGLFFCNKKARYSKSLMANFWRKNEYLKVFESDTFDGWSVEGEWLKEAYNETKGRYNNYAYYSKDPFHIVHSVRKGKWIRKAYSFFKKNGVPSELISCREKLSLKETFKFSLSTFFVDHFPSRFCYFVKKLTKHSIKYTTEY